MVPMVLVAAETVWGAGRVGSLWLQLHAPRVGARLCPLPPGQPRKADGEPWLQAVPQGWDSAILQKAFFCLLDAAWRSREPLGTWLHQSVDGLCGGRREGGSRTTQQLPPPFLLPGSLVPSCLQLPRGVLRGWLGSSRLLPQWLCSVVAGGWCCQPRRGMWHCFNGPDDLDYSVAPSVHASSILRQGHPG